MIVTHERRFLDLIERILERLDADSSRQVEIETKFLEVQEGALDEVSFDWSYNFGKPDYIVDQKTGMPLLDSRGQPTLSFPRQISGSTRTLSEAHSPTGVNRDTIISIPDNDEGSMSLSNPLPTLPGMIGIGTGAKPMLDAKNLNLSLAAGGGSMILEVAKQIF